MLVGWAGKRCPIEMVKDSPENIFELCHCEGALYDRLQTRQEESDCGNLQACQGILFCLQIQRVKSLDGTIISKEGTTSPGTIKLSLTCVEIAVSGKKRVY